MPPDVTVGPAGLLTLADYTRPGLIVPQLQQRDTAGIISELSKALQQEGVVSDVLPFYHAALNRELLSNSSLDCGIALPHGRLNGVKQLQFAFGRTPEPITWFAKGSWPVQFVFLLAVPATNAASYLHLLASLARLAGHPERRQELRAAEDAAGILAVLEKSKLRQ